MVAAECRHLANTRVTIRVDAAQEIALGDPSAERLWCCSRHRRFFPRRSTHRLLTVARPGRHRQDSRGPRTGRRVDLGLQGLRSSWLIRRRLETWSHDEALAAAPKLEIPSETTRSQP